MPAGQGTIEYVGKISLDASELMRVLGMGGAGGGGMAAGGGGATTAGDMKQQENIKRGMDKAHKDPSFMSIFKPLVALEGLKSLVSNSRVANSYLGGMGKMFSAAIDLLMLPFVPIFNLLMVGLSKLIGWLIDKGVLEWMAQGVEDLLGLMSGAWNTLKSIWDAIKGIGKAIWNALPEPIRKGLEAAGKVAADVFGPLGDLAKRAGGVLAAVAGLAVGGQMMAGMMGLGQYGPLALGASLFGRGGGGGGGGVGGMGTGVGVGAGMGAGKGGGGGFGGFGGRGWGLPMVAGGVALGQTAGQQGGALGAAGRIGSLGLTGAGIGTMIMPGYGTVIGAGLGLGVGAGQELGIPGMGSIAKMFGAGKPGGGGGGGTTSSGDVKNIGTQNITMNIYVKDKEMAKEIMEKVDEEMTASAEAGI